MTYSSTKDRYASPECEVLALHLEGVISVSPTKDGDPVFPSSGFGTEQQW